MDSSPTSDEKIMAALAHGSIFLMFFGPVVPVILWVSQRKKSNYVCFHSLQAMGYQVLMFWLWLVMPILTTGLILCAALPLGVFLSQASKDAGLASFVVDIIIFGIIFGFMALFFLGGMIGAVFCLLGREFRYPWIGKWLERHLPYHENAEAPIDEAQEENWVVGVCHATAVLQIWGMVTPLIVWFTQKERSARLRFQAMQALVYQGIALVVYMVTTVLGMGVFFGAFFIIFAAGAMGRGENVPAILGLIVLILIGGVMFVLGLGSAILVPIYYLLAGIASLRGIQGHSFRYPILGKIIERRIQTSQQLETTP